jgi:predicted DCC family thiol-disulfide oxidoreductase YuxK
MSPKKEADCGWRIADSQRPLLRIRAPAACVANEDPAGHIHVQQLSGSASDYPPSAIRHPLPSSNILVFDGVCVLCSRWVRFVLKHDRRRQFKFAAMQTPRGRDLLTRHGIDPDDPMSFLLLEAGAGYTDTDAIIRVLLSLGGGWTSLAWLLRIVPRFIRNSLYRWIARHRYRLFGRRDACLVPARDVSDRFLH